MEELLKELGYTDEQIKAIVEGMKNKKIFTSSEENIDLRYSKLKDDFKSKEDELTNANELIKQLQDSNKGNKDLQTKVTEYETKIAEMQKEHHEKDVDNALKLELLKNKAKADDIDYLIYKIKTNNDGKELELDDNGKLKDFKVDELKKEYKGNFEDESTTVVDVKTLGGNNNQNKDDKEPQNLLGALKDAYESSDDL